MKQSRMFGYAGLAGFCFLSVGLLLQGSRVARTVGKWAGSGDLSSARNGACAASLPGGATIIIGGQDENGALATAESLSLAGSTKLASMKFARAHFACATLPDGRVLVAGGKVAPNGAMNSAELYDPGTGTWSDANPMAISRAGATASVITMNGRRQVLLAGGESGSGATPSLEIFDPQTNSFSMATGAMSSARRQHAATVLPDGRVLIAGGSDGETILNSIDVFDPSTGVLSALSKKLSAPREGLTATTLLDGRVLLAGGNDGSADLASADLYNPADNSMSAMAMTAARSGHRAFLLPDNNTVMLAGGASGSVERFIPWRNEFQPADGLVEARRGFAGGTRKGLGVLMVAGGSNSNSRALRSTEAMNYATMLADQEIYSPGQPVLIGGDGWEPGETVKISVLRAAQSRDGLEIDTKADDIGRISITAYTFSKSDIGTVATLIARGSKSDAAIQIGNTAADGGATTEAKAASGRSETSTAVITTDKTKYALSEAMIISGTGFGAGARITISVLQPDRQTVVLPQLSASPTGTFSMTYAPPAIPGRYKITATDGTNVANTAATEADVFGGSLEQCRNGTAASPSNCVDLGGGGDGWANGNAGKSTAHYQEGRSIPYRLVVKDTGGSTISPKMIRVSIEWDTVHSGGVAIDYITYPRRIAEVVDPCSGAGTVIANCPLVQSTDASANIAGVNEFDLSPVIGPGGTSPLRSYVTADMPAGITNFISPEPATSWTNLDTEPHAHKMVVVGGTIEPGTMAYQFQQAVISGGSLPSTSSTRLQFDVRSTSNNFVLSWGGHIASRFQWGSVGGVPLSAGGISGSPYHTRLIGACNDLVLPSACTDGGNQDRSLSADAVLPPPLLTLIKTVTNDNGGTALPSAWTLTATGTTGGATPSISGLTGAAAVTNAAVNSGTYALTESVGPSGYTASSYSCVKTPFGGQPQAPVIGNSITLVEGDSAVCTINNNDQPPSLTLNKVVVNNNGGTAVASNWTLFANSGPTPISGAGPTVSSGATFSAGTYALSESAGPGGYTASAWVCTGGTQSGSNITVGIGQSVTCTITNDDDAPQLRLRKVVVNNNGGAAVAADWTLSASGPTPISGTTPVDSGATFSAGTYALTESAGPAGYTAGAWVCVGGTQNGSNITVGLGQSATCTITNDDNAAQLKLRKVVVNDNGGTAVAADWTLSAAGPTPLSGSTPVDSGATFSIGTYALTETGPANYTASAWVCVGGTQNGSNITVGLGQTATCTITNDDTPPSLTLTKVVVNNNGGTATPANWTLFAGGGPTPINGTGPTVSSGATFSAGTYALSESAGPGGYTASAWVCTGGTQNGSNITVGIGQSASCTITNDDDAPLLKLRKVIVNDNGGTAVAADWTLSAAGPTPLSGSTPVDSGATFSAGSYALSETGPTGYSASAWVCVGGTQNGSNITVGLGQSATCTITNDDTPPSLTLTKVVVNNNGGTATPANWTLFAGGPTPISGAGPTVTSGGTFGAGTYALSESSGPAGYTASAWVCVGGTQNGSNITIGIGQSASCTITNDDDAPQLHLRKVVINDNGGTALASAWTLSAAGLTPLSGSTPVDSGASFSAGTYALSETGPANYTASAWVCVGGTQNGSNITVGLGQSATCTITNDDAPPILTLNKVVVNNNGGTATPANWTLYAAGGQTPISGAGPTVTSGATFGAGTYALSESSGPVGYTASAWVCVGGTQVGSNITVGIGQSASCTITNDDAPPSLTLKKVVINGSTGGTAVPAYWTLNAGGGPTPISGAGPTVTSPATFNAGTYALSETAGPAGYSASNWVCVGGTQNGSNISVALGESAVCTITNSAIAPQMEVVKVLVPAGDAGRFNLRIDGAAYATNVGNGGTTGFVSVTAGAAHVASEVINNTNGQNPALALTDYVSTISCGGVATDSVILGLGQTVTCTITNTRKGAAKVIKTVNGRAPVSTDPPFTFQLRQGSSSSANGTILDSLTTSAGNGGVLNFTIKLTPGSTYQMCEVAYPGYGTTLGPPAFAVFNPGGIDPGVVCTNFTVNPGETMTFAINNTAPTTGGMTSTIGFWKNWASCANSKGNQRPVLDLTVEKVSPFGGIPIGTLTITDGNPNTTGDIGTYCDYAVNLLDKTPAAGGRKQASDPVFNLASQFMAYLLNISSGSTVCPTLQTNAQSLLTAVNFNGSTHTTLTAAQAALANQLAGQLDTYNNNGGCPAQ